MSMNGNENGIWNALERLISSSLAILRVTLISLVNKTDVDCGNESGIFFLAIGSLKVICYDFVNHVPDCQV